MREEIARNNFSHDTHAKTGYHTVNRVLSPLTHTKQLTRAQRQTNTKSETREGRAGWRSAASATPKTKQSGEQRTRLRQTSVTL